ncbi:PEGA domain-containing protein [Sphingobacterium bovisgrunnientis]|uniref:PEGA domain-containing protein n=1 Tax=Sphingobacterium bovisgrunnientis TaxID=1874697 RepID=UPI0013569220|nr:PEGA domain-containing protein [Sphingobacterium bovisgrunnientis]
MNIKYSKSISLFAASALLFASCASTTLINTTPAGAKVYLDGEAVGTTPYSHKDTKIVGTTTTIKLEKEGFEPFTTTFSRSEQADVGAIVGGVFFLFPFLWTMKYKPSRTYELIPLKENVQTKENK